MLVSRALRVLDWHCPVLRERTAEDGVVGDLYDDEAQPDVPEEEPHRALELRQLAAVTSQISRPEYGTKWENLQETHQEGPNAELDTPGGSNHRLFKSNN